MWFRGFTENFFKKYVKFQNRYNSTNKKAVTLIPGDGIGPEISEATIQVVSASKAPIYFEIANIRKPKNEHEKIDIDEVVKSFTRTKLALKGPLETPIGRGHTSLNLILRKKFNLYANVRPCLSIQPIKTYYDNVDLITIRENTEGEYSGLEHEVVDGVVQNIKVITKEASTRIVQFAFDYATRFNRKKITVVHKANIMRMSDGLFTQCAIQVAQNYPNMIFEIVNLDKVCYELVKNPSFDLGSGLIGGLGLTPSGNFGLNDFALFEAVHGTAPDIAGKDLANPTALILSATMLLKHINLDDYANRIYNAVIKTLTQDIRTKDLYGSSTCSEFTNKVVSCLNMNEL